MEAPIRSGLYSMRVREYTGEYWAERFESLRDRYRRDDGSRWTGAAIQRASDGDVKSSWVSDLSRGEIAQPSFPRIVAVSRILGIPDEHIIEEWTG